MKTETVGTISEFLHGKPEPVRKIHPASLAPLPLAVLATPNFAAAEGTKETIRHAFDPLISMITTLSFPIAGVLVTGGALMWMIGLKDKGAQYITNACLGFVLIQMSPMLLDILFGIGASL